MLNSKKWLTIITVTHRNRLRVQVTTWFTQVIDWSMIRHSIFQNAGCQSSNDYGTWDTLLERKRYVRSALTGVRLHCCHNKRRPWIVFPFSQPKEITALIVLLIRKFIKAVRHGRSKPEVTKWSVVYNGHNIYSPPYRYGQGMINSPIPSLCLSTKMLSMVCVSMGLRMDMFWWSSSASCNAIDEVNVCMG